jgi:electron transfer flavoprotein alpha subunit
MDFSYLDDWIEEGTGAGEIEEIGDGYRNIWVAAEVVNDTLLPAALATMGQARELADQIGVHAYGLLFGEGVEPLATPLIAYGADKVLVVDDPVFAGYQPEVYVIAMAELVEQYRPEIVLMPASVLGNDLAPRLAQRLNTGLISHCVKLDLDMSERLLLGTVPTLGGEVYRTFACPEARPQMATLQPGYFQIPYEDTYRTGQVERIDLDLAGASGRLVWTDLNGSVDLPPTPLSKARIVVAAGRGLGDADGFALAEKLSQALGGVVAGSRGAFDKGWITEEQIVGVGGAFIAPDLYIACGLSGDIHHSFGLQDAKFIVAINPDAEAPIMKVANMTLVGDARQVIQAMLDTLKT